MEKRSVLYLEEKLEEKKICEALKELFAEELREADKKGRTEGMELAKKDLSAFRERDAGGKDR